MAKSKYDLTNMRFGRLTVIEFAGKNEYGHILWRCQCDCGNEIIVVGRSLREGYTKSCGCLRRDVSRENKTIHGHRGERTYEIWKSMNRRCADQNNDAYKYYGGRGISVCPEWRDSYQEFYDWSMENGYSDDLSIDRIDNDDGYNPENCRWVDRFTQANNRRTSRYITYCGETHTIAEWSRLLNVHRATLRCRIDRGDMRDFEKHFNCIEQTY